MTILSLYVSAAMLTDINRRSFYLHATILGTTAWLQYWPRPIVGKHTLTCGLRGGE